MDTKGTYEHLSASFLLYPVCLLSLYFSSLAFSTSLGAFILLLSTSQYHSSVTLVLYNMQFILTHTPLPYRN